MRYYSSVASLTQLVGAISASDTSMIVASTTGLPAQVPFTLLLDEGTVSEEIVTVTNAAGTTLTISRGEDGTVGTAHEAGCRVRHAMTARDLRESRQHEDANTGVHGVTGAVVGTTDAQTLSNKVLDGEDGNAFANIDPSAVTGLTTHTGGSAGVHGVTGSVVGTSDAQTLTNKTIDGDDNSLLNVPKSALPADTAYTGDDVNWDGNHVFTAPGTGSVAVTLKAINGQTSNLLEIEPYGSSTPIVSIDYAGNLIAGTVASGDVTVTGDVTATGTIESDTAIGAPYFVSGGQVMGLTRGFRTTHTFTNDAFVAVTLDYSTMGLTNPPAVLVTPNVPGGILIGKSESITATSASIVLQTPSGNPTTGSWTASVLIAGSNL